MKNKRHFKCALCDQIFSRKDSTKKHIAVVHNGHKPFQCEHCGHSFSVNGKLTAHMSSVHERKGKKKKCEHCDHTSSSKSN